MEVHAVVATLCDACRCVTAPCGRLANEVANLRGLPAKAFRGINVRGELFSATMTFVVGAVVRLLSSLILTRLLYPEAYGIIAVLGAVLFVIEMLSDVGVVALVIRHERGDERVFLDTLWTIRLIRGLINCAILYASAPWLAVLIGDTSLAEPLRLISIYFLLNGLSSMSFALAMRHQKSRLVGYVDLACSVAATVFVITYSYHSRDHWGMVYGMLFERTLHAAASFAFYRDRWPRLAMERNAASAVFAFGKYVMPTSLLTMVLTQYDRLVLVRLFDLRTSGIVGVGASVAGPPDALTGRLCQFVLYPRCAAVHRDAPGSLRDRYYRDNFKLLALITALPPLLAGFGQTIVDILYDPRYRDAGFVLQALMIRVVLSTFMRPAEAVLTATGQVRVQLMANIIRVVWIVPASLIGFHLYGFAGFIVLSCMDAFPATAYVLYQQAKSELLIVRYEILRLLLVVGTFSASSALAWVLATVLNNARSVA